MFIITFEFGSPILTHTEDLARDIICTISARKDELKNIKCKVSERVETLILTDSEFNDLKTRQEIEQNSPKYSIEDFKQNDELEKMMAYRKEVITNLVWDEFFKNRKIPAYFQDRNDIPSFYTFDSHYSIHKVKPIDLLDFDAGEDIIKETVVAEGFV